MIGEIPDSVIVAVVDNDNGYTSDMELPTEMLVDDLVKGILHLLQEYEPRKYAGQRLPVLYAKERELDGGETLASAGIWDGTEIVLRFPEKKKHVGFYWRDML